MGKRVVGEALARGHEVKAVVRRGGQLESLDPRAVACLGDAAVVEEVVLWSRDADLVVLAIRAASKHRGEQAATTRAVLEGVARVGARLLVVGGAAGLRVRSSGLALIDGPRYLPPAARPVAQASLEQLEACLSNQGVDWIYVAPPAELGPGQRRGGYRVGSDELLVDAQGRSAISMEDLAAVILDEAEHPTRSRACLTAAYC